MAAQRRRPCPLAFGRRGHASHVAVAGMLQGRCWLRCWMLQLLEHGSVPGGAAACNNRGASCFYWVWRMQWAHAGLCAMCVAIKQHHAARRMTMHALQASNQPSQVSE